jgi:hypothetical protein
MYYSIIGGRREEKERGDRGFQALKKEINYSTVVVLCLFCFVGILQPGAIGFGLSVFATKRGQKDAH